MSDIRWEETTTDATAAPRESSARPAPSRDAARALEAAVPWVQAGTWAIGIAFALEGLGVLLGDRPSLTPETRMTLRVNIVTSLLLYGVIGLAAGRLLAALARLLEVQCARAEDAARTVRWCEETLAPALHRLTEALESAPARAPAGPAASGAKDELISLRRAIAEREWLVADQLIRDFVVAYPEHPEAALLAGELAQGREAATHDLLARLDAARAANDPDRVLELRDALALLLSGDPLRALDRDLAKWFLQVIHKRLRAGGVKPDIPLLAARVADALDTTPEGASLRASLPTLRRSAGLCARCAEPYAGIADACPKCVASTHAPPTTALPAVEAEGTPDEDDEDDRAERNGRADDPFLTDELT